MKSSLFSRFKRARAILIANGMHFNIYSNNKYIVNNKSSFNGKCLYKYTKFS